MAELIFKIVEKQRWETESSDGSFAGAPIDIADGYIHFSTMSQLFETANKHFRDQKNLLLIAVDPTKLGSALRFDPSRNGDLFPHLYSSLDLSSVLWVRPFTCASCNPHQVTGTCGRCT